MSENTDYDWYLKTHIIMMGSLNCINQTQIKLFLILWINTRKIQILPNNYSHKQIIKEKINFILTQHGSVGFEYPFFGIPVINASYNNPQIAYNFNLNPKK